MPKSGGRDMRLDRVVFASLHLLALAHHRHVREHTGKLGDSRTTGDHVGSLRQ